MKALLFVFWATPLLLCVPLAAPAADPSPEGVDYAVQQDYPYQPVPFTEVRFDDAFWAPRIEINRTVTIPHAFEKCDETRRFYHFERAAKVLRGEPLEDRSPPGLSFDDTDPYKVLEGAAFGLAVEYDAAMDAYLDKVIALIASAQEPDGYLFTTRTINPEKPHAWAGPERWINVKRLSHELYNMGHLYEAAVAHYQATGKRSLLDVAVKNADLLCETFGPGKNEDAPGHQIIEMALVRLYRATGERRYLDLAKFFLDTRGPGDGEYSQAHKKVVDQDEAVGHAVRATYMYAGMADVAALTGDAAYVEAMHRIWDNMASKKLYLTGGIGATASGEAFGPNYVLPNMTAYAETCAAIGNVYWNHRMFLLHGDGKYIDVMERTLYNGLISGVSLDGKEFFYPNPLESRGQHRRSPWFGCACCPGNIARFLASVPGYVYAKRGDALYVNLYAGGTANIELNGAAVRVRQETRYPWDGRVTIAVDPEQAAEFTVALRIPGWARNRPVPTDLYRYADTSDTQPTVEVNGRPVSLEVADGYVRVARRWEAGDRIELDLPMAVRRVVAHENVAATRNRIALERGPIVYCVEAADSPTGTVRNLIVAPDASIATAFRPDLLGGVEVLTFAASVVGRDDDDRLAVEAEVEVAAVPYAVWCNRGPNEMVVWLPTDKENAVVAARPTIASESRVTASPGTGRPASVVSRLEPRNSQDKENEFYHWWPRKGTSEWMQFDFAQPTALSAIEVYWLDDTGSGECRVPRSWRLLYRDGDAWKPVVDSNGYATEKDMYNRTAFTEVTTRAVRLEVELQPHWSAGVLQVRFE